MILKSGHRIDYRWPDNPECSDDPDPDARFTSLFINNRFERGHWDVYHPGAPWLLQILECLLSRCPSITPDIGMFIIQVLLDYTRYWNVYYPGAPRLLQIMECLSSRCPSITPRYWNIYYPGAPRFLQILECLLSRCPLITPDIGMFIIQVPLDYSRYWNVYYYPGAPRLLQILECLLLSRCPSITPGHRSRRCYPILESFCCQQQIRGTSAGSVVDRPDRRSRHPDSKYRQHCTDHFRVRYIVTRIFLHIYIYISIVKYSKYMAHGAICLFADSVCKVLPYVQWYGTNSSYFIYHRRYTIMYKRLFTLGN